MSSHVFCPRDVAPVSTSPAQLIPCRVLIFTPSLPPPPPITCPARPPATPFSALLPGEGAPQLSSRLAARLDNCLRGAAAAALMVCESPSAVSDGAGGHPPSSALLTT